MTSKRKGRLIPLAAIIGWLVFGAAAQAGHPLVTDDAGTVGKGRFQAEATAEFLRDRQTLDDGTQEKVEGAETALTLTYGLGENLDLVVAAPYQRVSAYTNGALDTRVSGIADMRVDLKWRFFEKDGWGVAVKPGIVLPTGNDEQGLGGGRTAYRLFLIGSKEIEPWAFHVNLGYIRNENKFEERVDLWHASAAAELELVKDLKAVANLGMERNPSPASANHPAFALGGLVYHAASWLSLDAGVKFGLTTPEADTTYLLGLTVHF